LGVQVPPGLQGTVDREKIMFRKIKAFITDVKAEMSKVSWPPREELLNSTLIVAGVSLAFTVFIFVVEYILAWTMRVLMNLF
jgi:preprotein translocase subunit SecE